MTKKIAVINDLSGFGKCSLTAASHDEHAGAHGGLERPDRVSQLLL